MSADVVTVGDRGSIVFADTVTMLDASHRDGVLITGSHGGLIAAYLAAHGGVRAAIFNDAGGGLDGAGFAGIDWLERFAVAAATVAHTSARIADASDTYANGVISHANALARGVGVRVGQRCQQAAAMLRSVYVSPTATRIELPKAEARTVLRPADGTVPEIRGLDSIGLAHVDDAGTLLVIGSHGGLHGGRAESALSVDAAGAVFHDAGRGKDGAWCSRLPVLNARGIAAATVDYETARIGDAKSIWDSGVISSVNDVAATAGWQVGHTVQRALVAQRG